MEYQVYGQNKIDRIESILLPVFQRSRCVIMEPNKNSYKIWNQIKHLAVAQHDDGADAFSTVVFRSRVAGNIDYQGSGIPSYMRQSASHTGQAIPDWMTV